MSPKIYTQEFKDAVVKYYERNHTIQETKEHFNVSESSLFAWKKEYDESHHLSVEGQRTTSNYMQKQRHLLKTEQMLEVLRSASCGVNSSIDEKMKAIDELEGKYSVRVLCEALNLPRGTYYNRKRRENTITSYEINDAEIKPLIEKIFMDSKKRFGRKPIRHKLSEIGYQVSEKRVCRLMQEMGLEVEKPQFYAEHKKPIPRLYLRNYLYRNFDQPAPNLVWITDITYVKVAESFCYICVYIDLFSRMVLSYGISDTIDSTLTMKIFDSAFQKRGCPKGLMVYSDQGAQYTSHVFRSYMKKKKVRQSFSTPGTPYDNSVCESFFHVLKNEAIYRYLYQTPLELEAVVKEYIHFFNEERPHRKLDMKTPLQFETESENM